MDLLINKQYKQPSYLSRYTPFPYYYHILDKKYVQGTVSYLSDQTLYTLHTIQQGDTFDNLALKYYNNPTYYWIICSFNRIQDPFQKLVPGCTLKIPAMSNIEFDIE